MKKILTIILDGFGVREDIDGNAIKMAGMNNFIDIWNNYPHCLLKASGENVNLPTKQCSCSEIGHKIIGAGREIENKLNEVNRILKHDSLKYNRKYSEMIDYLKRHPSNNLHIVILLSDGGVSSHINHLKWFINELNKSKIENNVYIDAISDGRDADKHSLNSFVKEIDNYLTKNIKLSSICGRYYALDQTRDYKRTKMYYDLLFNEKGIESPNISLIIKKCYDKKISDEYMPPIKTSNYCVIDEKDTIMLLNFSKDNQAQLLESMSNEDFVEFDTHDYNNKIYSLYEIDPDLNKNYFFDTKVYENTLTEYLASLDLSQAHIYENIKASSMNYFLKGEKYVKLDNCDIYTIDSPEVDSFDMKPEMQSLTIAKTAIKCMEEDYDFILVNFANPDEIGHTGNYQATINALQAIDVCLGKILEKAEENFYKIVIVGSHSNADTIIDRDNKVITKNTLSPVPFIIMDNKVKLTNGNLSSFAPTLLKYMDIAIPKEMKDSEILIEKNKKVS